MAALRASDGSGELRSARLANELKQQIALGQYPVGTALPTEIELCGRFGVSRYTVREALRRLAELGLVASRQGSGTRVIAQTPRAAYVHSLQSLSEISQYTRDTRFDIQSIQLVALGAEDAEHVPAPEGSRWIQTIGMRRTPDGEAIAFSKIFVHGRFARLMPALKTQIGPIYAFIERETGEVVVEVRQIIRYAAMPIDAAAALKLKSGAPAIFVTRRYLDLSGGPMLTSVSWHPAERFTYAITLQRDSID